jgi:hypothetical protein
LRLGGLLRRVIVQRPLIDDARGQSGGIHVRLDEADRGLRLGPTKSHTTRSIDLPKFLTALHTEHLSQALPGGTGAPTDLVFPSEDGIVQIGERCDQRKSSCSRICSPGAPLSPRLQARALGRGRCA